MKAKDNDAVTDKRNDKEAKQNKNYCYILKCRDNSYYTGWTNNLEKRLQAHQEGCGAKYTRGRTPVELIYFETFSTKEEAMRREYEIKHLTRKEKEMLISKCSE